LQQQKRKEKDPFRRNEVQEMGETKLPTMISAGISLNRALMPSFRDLISVDAVVALDDKAEIKYIEVGK
jgi:hypothetical protein